MAIKTWGPWAAAAGMLTLTGCAATSPAGQTPPPSPVPALTAATAPGLHLPIERYMLTPEQTAELDWIRHAATNACMRSIGFDGYDPPPRTYRRDSTVVGMYSVMARRYGVADPATAHRWGYELPRSAESTPDPSKVALGAKPKEEQLALLGADPSTRQQVTSLHGKAVPAHGCLNAVDTLVVGTDSGGMQGPGSSLDGIVSEIKAVSFQQSKADPRVTSAFTAWSGCMKDHGYAGLSDPLTAPAAVVAGQTDTPSAAEIAQADADVACKSSTNLINTWFAVESDLQNAAIAQRAHDLDAVRTDLDAESADITRLIQQDFSTLPSPAR